MIEDYLDSVKKQFEYYKGLGDRTFAQLDDEDLFWKYNDSSNSIAVMVHHLSGNMKSRWTDFLTSDGEKSWRNRDQEFADVIRNRQALMEHWDSGWAVLFEALESITPDNIETIVYIRNEGHSIVEAINRQLAHYSYHIGQLVYLGRMCKGEDWNSLSIPKGASTAYNKDKFAQPKSRKHFTDDV